MRLGKLSVFSNPGSPFDVLKVDVESPKLHRLNRSLRDGLEHQNDYPDYHPHLTVAYLKKGAGAKYAGDTRFAGKILRLDELTHSSAGRQKTRLRLDGNAAPAPVLKTRQAMTFRGRAAVVLKVENGRATIRVKAGPSPSNPNVNLTAKRVHNVNVRELRPAQKAVAATGKPAATPPASEAPRPPETSAASPGPTSASLAPARPARTFRLPYGPSETPDILNHIAAEGGMASRKVAQASGRYDPKAHGDYDAAPTLRGIHHQAVFGGRVLPDAMANTLATDYHMGDGTVETMFRKVAEALQSRATGRTEAARQATLQKQGERFGKEALTERPGAKIVHSDNLNVGDTLTIHGESHHLHSHVVGATHSAQIAPRETWASVEASGSSGWNQFSGCEHGAVFDDTSTPTAFPARAGATADALLRRSRPFGRSFRTNGDSARALRTRTFVDGAAEFGPFGPGCAGCAPAAVSALTARAAMARALAKSLWCVAPQAEHVHVRTFKSFKPAGPVGRPQSGQLRVVPASRTSTTTRGLSHRAALSLRMDTNSLMALS